MITKDSGNGHRSSSTAFEGPYSKAAPAAKATQRAASNEHRVQIAAARLRLVTDSQLRLETPDWVKELAAGKPSSRTS